MSSKPHDLTDLYLAPVALAVDAELAVLDPMSAEAIEDRIALGLNRQPRDLLARRQDLLDLIARDVDLHGWQAAWVARGLSLSHEGRSLALGVPGRVRTYLEL